MGREERTVCFDKELQIEAYRFQGILQRFPNHFHEYYVIGYIESGTRHLSCKNREYTVGAGDLLLFNPLDNHTCEQIDDRTLDYRCINVNPDIMLKTSFEITGKNILPSFNQTVVARCDMVSLLQELHQAVMEEQIDFKKEETFLFLMEQLLNRYTDPSEAKRSKSIRKDLKEVCHYLDSHYSERISLDDLSQLSGRNKYSLLRDFTKTLGITPYRYLETVRINEAKKMLEKGVLPIEAALQTGFADQSHFTNHFKSFIGLTPTQYQNIFISNDNEII